MDVTYYPLSDPWAIATAAVLAAQLLSVLLLLLR